MSTEIQIVSLSDEAFHRLAEDAASHGLSPSEWAARVLETHYPPAAAPTALPADTDAALQRLFGSWDEVQSRDFAATMAESDKIDETIWK